MRFEEVSVGDVIVCYHSSMVFRVDRLDRVKKETFVTVLHDPRVPSIRPYELIVFEAGLDYCYSATASRKIDLPFPWHLLGMFEALYEFPKGSVMLWGSMLRFVKR